MKARAWFGAVVLAASLGLSGCGSTEATLTAAQEVPALSAALSAVDSALARHQYVTARKTLATLIVDTQSAQRNGTLSAARAQRILAAARTLLASIPKPTPTPTPTAAPTRTPAPSPTAERATKEPKKHGGKGRKGHDD